MPNSIQNSPTQATADSDRIRQIASDFLTIDRLDALFQPARFPLENLIPRDAYGVMKEFSLRLSELTRQLAIQFRDAGLCSRCPNSDFHGLRGIDAWNDLIDGKWDDPIEAKNLDRFNIDQAPLFRTLSSAVSSAATHCKTLLWESSHPGSKNKISQNSPIMNEEEYTWCLEQIRQSVQKELTRNDGLYCPSNERSNLIHDSVRNWGDMTMLRPVLSAQSLETGKLSRVPSFDQPKSVRHIELSLPSGRLIMADWFRIHGFNEGLKSLLPENKTFEISYAYGLDERAKVFFESLGLVIVQVGNTSPYAYADVDGVWRMGRLDEDHDDFWDEDGEAIDVLIPEAVWHTCTDMWSNTFADVEVIVDILMASGEYETREKAMSMVEEYASEHGANIVDMQTDRLHLYVPTGYGVNMENFQDVFQAKELQYPEWREDFYVLSRDPLTVDANIVENSNWIEGCVDPEISQRYENVGRSSPRLVAG